MNRFRSVQRATRDRNHSRFSSGVKTRPNALRNVRPFDDKIVVSLIRQENWPGRLGCNCVARTKPIGRRPATSPPWEDRISEAIATNFDMFYDLIMKSTVPISS